MGVKLPQSGEIVDKKNRPTKEIDEAREEIVFPSGPSGSIDQLVHIFSEHEREHAEDIHNLKGNIF